MVIQKMQEWEHAVSPVVGVMLMLVVTIIIAAVVSSFATALTGDVETGSDARVDLVGISSGGGQPRTFEQIGVVFKNSGGGTLDLRNLKFYMTGSTGAQGAFTLTYDDPVSLEYVEGSPYLKGSWRSRVTLTKNATGYRMQKFGSGLTLEELKDPIVEPGERFIIYSEFYMAPSYSPSSQLGFKVDRGDPDDPIDTWASGAIAIDGGSAYTLSDLKTGVVYSSGYLEPEHIF
ncbi:type IV pilin [Methanofollis ethanolicus]|uniref:type IV pilin n=1 Tax=Methanofollis ethanolicus TaxID=488124 RepID=UPI00083478F6|nr:type IV pilin N-terminal domain-containing protein [Methanofollis ethanolicus]